MKKSLFFCFLLCYSSLFSQTRDAQQAQQLATQFFFGSTEGKQNAPANETLQLVYTRQNERVDAPVKNLFYIFNKTNGGGFVIISGDERAKTVLGYSEKGKFDPDKIPGGLGIFLTGYSQEIGSIPDNIEFPEIKNKPLTIKSIVKGVGPLINTDWGQENPFNSLCPNDNSGGQCRAGCGPVAMAQIIYYHGFPLRSVVGNKIDDYDSNLNIPLLIRRCGDAAKSFYCTGNTRSTETITENVVTAFIENFSYAPDLKINSRMWYNDSKWEELLKKELDNGRPIYYTGQNDTGSHAFICDGYKLDNIGFLIFHFNIGWGGECNDCNNFYSTFNISPKYKDNKYYSFNDSQQVITGIRPYCAGKNISMEKLIMYPEKTSRVEINFGVNLEVKNLRNEDKYYTQFDLTSFIENENKERFPIIHGQFAYQGLIYLPLTTKTQWIGDFVIIHDTVKNGNYKLYAGYYLPYNKEPNMNYHYAKNKRSKEPSMFDSIVPIPTYTGSKNYLDITISDDSVYFNKKTSDLKIIQAEISNEINFSYSESKISFYSEELVKIVSIYSFSGAKIKIIPINKMGEITISTNNFPKACYLVRVETDEGRKTGKFIKF